MPIKIVSKKNGFRRAGRVHTGAAVYPDGTFTSEELALLKAEPLLIVEEEAVAVAVEAEPKSKGKK
ncbi:MAG: hypothetical protein LBT47_01085 [Deltaproteobacteria bacterium]|jgi:hypothetical protein|nr:hypothetical protein [Deltaproteobacteria bacterium]